MKVEVGCAGPEAERMNEAYIHWVQTGRPFTILKAGMTLDGKIATAAGESQWITGERAREQTHQLRAGVDAILIGVGTLLRDNPSLTARILPSPSGWLQDNRCASWWTAGYVLPSGLRSFGSKRSRIR